MCGGGEEEQRVQDDVSTRLRHPANIADALSRLTSSMALYGFIILTGIRCKSLHPPPSLAYESRIIAKD